MTKFTIIICVIAAVCVFQTAKAEDSDNSMENSSLSHESVKELENHEQELVKDNPKACTNAYNKNRKIVEDLVNDFNNCVLHNSNSANRNVQQLIDSVNRLQTTILKDLLNFPNYRECFKHILDTIPCFNRMFWDNISKLTFQIDNIVITTFELMKYFPNVRVCYDNASQRLTGATIETFMKNQRECFKSYLPFY